MNQAPTQQESEALDRERESIYREQRNVKQKTLHNSDISGTRKNVTDVKVVGNGDTFQLLCKASSEKEGWMKSTKAMEVEGGSVVQVTTQQTNPDGSYSVAEALAYVPGVIVVNGENGGRRLKGMYKDERVIHRGLQAPWAEYKRTGLSEMRPYIPGESLSDVSVRGGDSPEVGGMIARNPKDHADQWYVSKKYFAENLSEA